jgi:hypothetical protein
MLNLLSARLFYRASCNTVANDDQAVSERRLNLSKAVGIVQSFSLASPVAQSACPVRVSSDFSSGLAFTGFCRIHANKD